MSVNITVNGFCYNSTGNLSSANVNYQMFFYKDSTASSDSAWNAVRTVENTGYFSSNIGDTDWMGQEASILINSKVLIVFWASAPLSIDRNQSCTEMIEWGATELIIDGSSSYTLDVQIRGNILPNLLWFIVDDGWVNSSYLLSNNSNDIHSWLFGATTMYHWYERYSQIINANNNIVNTIYTWGDSTPPTNVSGVNNTSHSWNSAGTYLIETVIEDTCSATVTGTKSIDIKWNPPIPAIEMTPSTPEPNQAVIFNWSGTDVDNTIVNIDWVIVDSGVYGNYTTTASGSRDTIISHIEGIGTSWYEELANVGAFSNPGNHQVDIVYYWFDGFELQSNTYSYTFTQSTFVGPTTSFNQTPTKAVVNSEVSFENTSINISRVGLDFDHTFYDWIFMDGTQTVEYLNRAYSYIPTFISNSANCSIQLCANWNDGFEDYITCISGSVAFETTVSVLPDDCYYSIRVTGTSDDGTTSGYSWTVSSGASDTGPWGEIWSSPISIDQQEKSLGFTATGWYKVEGFVYGDGNTTSDDEIMFVTEVCPDSDVIHNIWDGTGILDVATDWERGGLGVETTASYHTGTNGLSVVGAKNNDEIYFYRKDQNDLDINNYDFLSFWINIKDWNPNKDIYITLYSTNYEGGTSVNISKYMRTDIFDIWTRVVIPLREFQLIPSSTLPGWPTMANRLKFTMNGHMSFWLDQVLITMGALISVPITAPNIGSKDVGNRHMKGIGTFNTNMRTFQGPINL